MRSLRSVAVRGNGWDRISIFPQAWCTFRQGALRTVPLVAVRRLPLAARFEGAVVTRQFSAGVCDV